MSSLWRRLPDDWERRHALRPVLLEARRRTCYRAANWTKVGAIQGRGKLDANALFRSRKSGPLQRNWRRILNE